jgi:uncharacterized membrane protein
MTLLLKLIFAFCLMLNLAKPMEISAQSLEQNQVFEAEISEVLEQTVEPYDQQRDIVYQKFSMLGLQGEYKQKRFEAVFNQIVNPGEQLYKTGDKVVVSLSIDAQGQEALYVIDYVRRDSLAWLFVIFAGLVVLIGRKHGIASLVGLASSFFIMFTFLLPLIQRGYEPIIVALLSAAAIIFVTFSVSHGLNQKTLIAMIGTTISLCVTALLATAFLHLSRLTGFGSEEATFLQYLNDGQLNMTGLLLAGIIIGTLGVLDDITISQASVVQELKSLNPKIHPLQLFKRAMNVGHDHIASLVNTLILVYVGGSLPLLMLFNLDPNRSYGTVINYSMVAEEVVATLVGSIGIVIAVPITTFIASYYGFKSIKKTNSKTTHSH